MQICYIPAVTTPTLCAIDLGIKETIESAMQGVIDNMIVKPFQNWCHGIWMWTVDTSLPACTTVSLVALMLYMVGVKSARKWIIIPIIVYVFIQIANAMLGGAY
ncbi:hypothetical protein CS063_01665 [Sporanaerobium hydrogeniformans]|uniref:Uncharacterized protein n=1 Tax=Sporanaerobium hydrogeniformans TaxID=3072179 RepID=A0AC61DHE8_9FIRM|nr:hypothetical protein [Sporanaerobium hydrogeniformans]PHV72208.1 hypothetical protein CS063_01665 [Sporanaerobium hydrogeniformans]